MSMNLRHMSVVMSPEMLAAIPALPSAGLGR
ncbi:UNVERIFIED_ORG: hypothetical protein ABIB52_004679 [Arthrobacter sp. UYCu721]